MSISNVMLPRTHFSIRTMRCRSVAVVPVTGMKSITSPAPDSVMNRVTRIAVSGKYNCFVVYVVFSGATRKCPPFSRSSSDPNTLGESKRGQQNQSIVPSVVTRAAVWRSPISPWFSIRGTRPSGTPLGPRVHGPAGRNTDGRRPIRVTGVTRSA